VDTKAYGSEITVTFYRSAIMSSWFYSHSQSVPDLHCTHRHNL